MLLRWIGLGLVLLLAGCASMGPRQVGIDRNRYNNAIQKTDNQELLANIVRLRYLEPLSFLKLANVTAAYTLTPFNTQTNNGLLGLSTVATGGLSTITRTLNFTPSVGYSDSPTITYAPLVGKDFVSDIMTPVELETLHLFAYGGPNDPAIVFRLAVQALNNLDNASSASNPKPYAIPKFEKYFAVMHVLVDFIRQGQCVPEPTEINKSFALSIHCFDPSADAELKSLFHIPQRYPNIILADEADPKAPKNVIFLQMRSVHGILSFLSHGVQVPEADVISGVAPALQYSDGTPFDWTPLMQDLWTVYTSKTEPYKNVFVKAYVHKHWFYIKDSDSCSKETFDFIFRLITLTTTQQVQTTGPLLTIPAR